jgi:hypothetical protein
MSGIGSRIMRAARLEPALYEEVEGDRTATGQALAVVVLSSIAGGVGAFGEAGLLGLAVGALSAVLGWVLWAFTILVIGTKLMASTETRSDMGELMRTLGFASAPGLVRVAGIIPGFALIVGIVAGVWTLAAMVVAVRQALDYSSTGRAVLVCLAGFALNVLVALLIYGLLPGSFKAP